MQSRMGSGECCVTAEISAQIEIVRSTEVVFRASAAYRWELIISIDDAITVFGGYGYFLEQDVERRYRDNRIVEVYEGTVEVQLNNICRILKKTNLDYLANL